MNAALSLLLPFAMVLALAAPRPAQTVPEVPLGTSYWSFGGDVVKVDVTENPDPAAGNSWLQGVDSSGFSGVADGTGTTGCMSSGEFSTSGGTYKVIQGKVCKKNPRGKWVNGIKVRAPHRRRSGRGSSSSMVVLIGDEVVTLP